MHESGICKMGPLVTFLLLAPSGLSDTKQERSALPWDLPREHKDSDFHALAIFKTDFIV